jgi:hypothetical protein
MQGISTSKPLVSLLSVELVFAWRMRGQISGLLAHERFATSIESLSEDFHPFSSNLFLPIENILDQVVPKTVSLHLVR